MAESNTSERNWGMLCHLSSLCCWLGVPFGNILGPLVVWMIKKDESPLVETEGKESINFQISMTIYAIIAAILIVIAIGIPLLIAIGVAQIVLVIVASVKVNSGEAYKYPMTIRFLN